MKVYMVGGKGGVGKTTLAGFLSILLSERGKTRIISTDIAHSLRDFFEVRERGERFYVRETLEAYEPDIKGALKEYVEEIDRRIRKAFSPVVYRDFEPFLRFSASDPSNYDTVLFEIVKKEILKADVDYLVVDTAATAQLLKFFALPDKLIHWYGLLIKWRQKYLSLKTMVKGDSGEDLLLNHAIKRKKEVEEFKDLLLKSSFIWVLEPSDLSIRETLRTLEEIKGRINIRGFVFNKSSERPVKVTGVLKKNLLVEIPLFHREPKPSNGEGRLFLELLKNFLT